MITVSVDTTVMQTIEHFFVYGLPPGSYTERLLTKDPNSEKYAHPLLLKDNKQVHLGHVAVVNDLPDVFTGENASNWPGLTNMSRDQVKELYFELKLKGCKFTEMIIKEYADDLPDLET